MNNSYYENINYLAVFISAIIYFFLGALWYSKILFGSLWQRLQQNINTNSKGKKLANVLIVTYFLTFITVFLSATLVAATGSETFMEGFNLGTRLSVGFMFTSIGITFLYENRPLKLFFIDTGYHFFGIVISTIILSIWK